MESSVLRSRIRYFAGSTDILLNIKNQKPYSVFSEETIEFINEFSRQLFSENRESVFVDVSAFAFWCRKASLLEMKKQYEKNGSLKGRMGRGLSVHFAPSNIPVLFGYSMVTALLAGNTVVLRLSSQQYEQEEIIVKALDATFRQYSEWKNRICLIRYEHDTDITDYFSRLCDARVIWGGDNSVDTIRRSILSPRAVELTFPDRCSAAVFLAEAVLEQEDMSDIIKAFYNDTYLNDQNTCSSPRLIHWIGSQDKIEKAKTRFWNELSEYVNSNYSIDTLLAVKKLEQAMYLSVIFQNVNIHNPNSSLTVLDNIPLDENIWNYVMPGGFFFQTEGEDIQPLLPALTDKCQTLVCYGIDREKLMEEIVKARARGVDRIVGLGHSLDFSLVWDGIDMIEFLSRKIIVSEI